MMRDLWHVRGSEWAVYTEDKPMAAQIKGWQKARPYGTYTDARGRWRGAQFVVPMSLLRRACRLFGFDYEAARALGPTIPRRASLSDGVTYQEAIRDRVKVAS